MELTWMDDVLNWLKTRAEHEAAVLALALLRALVLAPVVALAPVQGVPGAKAEAAPRGERNTWLFVIHAIMMKLFFIFRVWCTMSDKFIWFRSLTGLKFQLFVKKSNQKFLF